MENNLQELLIKFERDPTVGSKAMDLLSRYSVRVGAITRTDVVVMALQFHSNPWKTAYVNS